MAAYDDGTTPFDHPTGDFWSGGPPSLTPSPTDPAVAAQLHTAADAPSGNAALWAQVGQNPQAFIQALIARDHLVGAQTDPTALNHILSALKEVGVNAALDTRTDQYHKGIMLNGQFVKLLDGNDRWTWDTGGGASGAAPISIDPSYLSPFTKPVPTYGGPGAFNYPEFQAPTAQEVENEPGRAFRVDQGRKEIETGASAKGLLNSGGTLADVLGFGQQMASQEYQNIFNRKRDMYATNRSNAADIYRTNYDSQFLDPFARQLQTFDRQKDIWYANQSNPFAKIMDAANLGRP